MARNIGQLLLVFAVSATCMEMRETVERMVMVRTTGSDLQPAATGYIYKKDSNGPANVIEMGESEVMEHLSKLYEQPKAFKAPIPAASGPFYSKDEEEKNNKAAAYSSETKVIPVVENRDEDKDDHIDGIAHEDYKKLFGEYATDYGDYKSDFDEYLKSLGYFEDGLYHGLGGKNSKGKDYGYADKAHEGYGNDHEFGKGGAGDYHSEKYESFSVSGKGGHKKAYGDADGFGKHYADGHQYKDGDKEGHDGFHKFYKKDDSHDRKAHDGGFHKFDEHDEHGSDTGRHGSHDAEHDDGHSKGSFHEEESGDEHTASNPGHSGQAADLGAGEHHGKSYGYAIEH